MMSYLPQWKDLRRRQILSAVAFLGFPVEVIITSYAAKRVFHGPPATPLLSLFWAALSLLANLPLVLFLCPRCNRPFFRPANWSVYFIKRCVHCSLPKWAAEDTSGEVYIDGVKRAQFSD